MDGFPQIETTKKLSELIHRAVDKSYEDLYSLTRRLQHESDEDRRDSILEYIKAARYRFMQLLVLVKWSAQSPLTEQCSALLERSQEFTNQLNETNDKFFFMHADLNRAKERPYDILSAVDVLYGGTFSRLPTIISNAMCPPELPEVDISATSSELNEIIQFRMLETEIPAQFTHVAVENGFLNCSVSGEFEIVLTVQGKDSSNPWCVVSVDAMLSSSQGSSVAGRNVPLPTEAHYVHLRNLVQRKLNDSDKPLVDAFTIMRDFCSCLALDMLGAQASLLIEGRWKNRVSIQYYREEQVLDICYWSGQVDLLIPSKRKKRSSSSGSKDVDAVPLPSECLCVRIAIDTSGSTLLRTALHPPLPPELASASISDTSLPPGLQALSVERIVLGAMKAHAALGLHYLQQRLTIKVATRAGKRDVPDFASTNAKLMSGEPINVHSSGSSLTMRKTDLDGLQSYLELAVDIRTGQFVVSTAGVEGDRVANMAIDELQKILQTPPHLLVSKKDSDEDSSLHAALSNALRELLSAEIAKVGRACIGVDPERSVPLDWKKLREYREAQNKDCDHLSISPGALFFKLGSNNEAAYYLVIEADQVAEIDGHIQPTESKADWITMPRCVVLHISKRLSFGGVPSVQNIQYLPAFRKSDIVDCTHRSKRPKCAKDSLMTSSGQLKAFLLAAVQACKERMQIQYILNDAHRLKIRVKYSGEGGTSSGEGTGGQVLVLTLPDNFSTHPIKIGKLTVHFRRGGGLEICLTPVDFPFTVVRDAESEAGYEDLGFQRLGSTSQHRVLSDGRLLFRYPAGSGFWYGRPCMEVTLEDFVKDLVYEVTPLVSFIAKLEKFIKEIGRSQNPNKPDGRFYIEKCDPFSLVLVCRCKNSRTNIAAGGTRAGVATYRVSIEYKKHSFILNFGDGTPHLLLNHIQSAFNTHQCPRMLFEILERTIIPLAMISSVVESKLLSAKYHRPDDLSDKDNGTLVAMAAGSGKKGGKGMKLGYKGKFGKGMRLGYTSDKTLVADDKIFTPSELVLIPRSQDRIKLAYSNRCSVDLWFLKKKMVKIKCASGGLPVPSCSSEDGQTIAHNHLADKIQSICTEMATL